MERVDTTERLRHLRQLMTERKVDVYVVPSEDSHQSEYIAPCDARREFICGFSGSAGCAVVTLEKAALATDGRYFNQAQKQLDSNWTLLKHGAGDPSWQEWTVDQSEGGKTVGVDPTVVTAADARKLHEKIAKKGGAGLVAIKENLIDQIWGEARPPRPSNPVKVLGLEFAGITYDEKLEYLRKELEKAKSPGIILSMLDEIAWLFNLRGSDIPYNPVFYSYAIITASTADLFVDSKKISDAVRDHLADAVTIRPYESIFDETRRFSQSLLGESEEKPPSARPRFLISSTTSWALSEALGGEEKVEEVRSPVAHGKSVKNDVEIAGMKACHIRDGASLIEYFAWLEHELCVKKTKLDEVQGADKLEEIRSKKEHFMGLSFDTISSTGPNAAIIHYKPERNKCDTIDPAAVYLCDSGAQYLDGTTDTTRTLHFTQPTEMERKAYTLVLKGNIALDRAVFPRGTNGLSLDVLARQFLWEEGLDYRHGTGHGVGSYLNVHEGPIGIGTRLQYAETALSPGNVLSDEPGYYEDGRFGIRIENVVIVKEAKTTHQFGDLPYICFEHATMVPMCRNLIDEKLLTFVEKDWLNKYHAEVLEKTKDFFQPDSLAMKWLERETKPI
ncbi:MAG: TATA-box-binding protein [Watsoniomyces obsoletus]|nr:MAG: TATA-box-binding protein [Watsoniomyces obsoletus]